MAMEAVQRPKDDQNFWNFWLLVFSGVVLLVELWILAAVDAVPTSIGLLDIVLIAFATFRLTRLFVYDSIMHFLRDLFLKRTVTYTADGEIEITREKYQDGLRRAMSDLFSCPWCTGLQLAILIVFFFYLTPLAWIVILMFAVGGAATLLQLGANALGWRAESLKRETQTQYPAEHIKGASGGTCG